MTELNLFLIGDEVATLEKTAFTHPLVGEVCAMRGRESGPFRSYKTFLWSPAVQSMTVLLLKTAALQEDKSTAYLEGYDGSLASSLDYGIGKATNWLLDMFGVDSNGLPLAKRLFRRTNPERKRPGPVTVSVNAAFLPAANIKVHLNGVALNAKDTILQLAAAIEKQCTGNRPTGALGPRRLVKKALPADADKTQPDAAKSKSAAPAAAMRCPCCGECFSLALMVANG